MLATDLARKIVEFQIERGWQTERWCQVGAGPADSSIFDDENGNCIARDLSRPVSIGGVEYEGARFAPADKKPGSRHQGWQQLRKYLSNVEPKAGIGREEPGLFVWSSCSHWLRTVPTLPRDEKDMDDVDTVQRTAVSATEVKGILHSSSGKPTMTPESRDALLYAIAKARAWIDDLMQGRVASLAEMAKREGKVEDHVRFLARLAFVSPGVVAAIIHGSAPAELNVTTLAKAVAHRWIEQQRGA